MGDLIVRYDLVLPDEETSGSMGAGFVRMENDRFNITVGRERGGCRETIEVAPKIRTRKGAHLSSWPLGHLRGFLDDSDDHFRFDGLDAESDWLLANQDKVLDVEFLNSVELRQWAAKAARRLFDGPD